MKTYRAIPQARFDPVHECEIHDMNGRVVVEREPGMRNTGILDASGTPLYAIEEMDPIGFIRLKERRA